MRNKFFKLNWKVLSLTLIIFVILSFIPTSFSRTVHQCIPNQECKSGILQITYLFNIYLDSFFEYLVPAGFLITTLIIHLTLSYLISCLIFYRKK
jgi:hypothetical protein